MIYTKNEPLNIHYGIDGEGYNDEGRIITLEFENYYFVNVYVPNSQPELKRLDYRMSFEDNFRIYLNELDKIKPVVLCGDLNVAHKEIDLKNPKSNLRNPGFTIEERTKFQELLDSGFIDTYRFLNPETVNATGMLGIAVIGIAFNGAGYFLLKKGESLNEKVLSWHLLEDVLGWVGILVGAIVIYFWNVYILDPIITIALTAFILYNVSKNLKEAVNILLQGVPKHIDLEAVKQDIKQVKGVIGIHDIHIWSLEGETDVFTAHIILNDDTLKNRPEQTKQQIKELLQNHHIEHSTIEIESKNHCTGNICELDNKNRPKN